jgi:hypothetical protein
MVIPQLILYQETDVASAVVGVKQIMSKVTNQKYLTTWYRTNSPTRQELIRLRTAYPSLHKRLEHLSPIEYNGSHKPFDLNPKTTIRHQPNAFLKTFFPVQDEGMSQHQMALYLKLLLGLPIPTLSDSVNVCPCGQTDDFHGYHRLNCKQNDGRANRAAHDLVQLALKGEFQRLNIQVVDNDREMRQRYAHLSSQKI